MWVYLLLLLLLILDCVYYYKIIVFFLLLGKFTPGPLRRERLCGRLFLGSVDPFGLLYDLFIGVPNVINECQWLPTLFVFVVANCYSVSLYLFPLLVGVSRKELLNIIGRRLRQWLTCKNDLGLLSMWVIPAFSRRRRMYRRTALRYHF